MAEWRYVDVNIGADDQAHGTSAQAPWKTIQYSVYQLSQLPAGKKTSKEPAILWVISGPYQENVTMKGKQYSDIHIQGYNVTVPHPAGDYDWGAFCEGRPPVDGQAKGPVFTIEDATGIVLQDLNILNGKADHGAGVFATKSQVSLITCCIHDNQRSVALRGSGGGLAFDQCNPGGLKSEVKECVIYHNTAGRNGGGGWIHDTGDVTITKTLVHHNTADIEGGGLALEKCRNISIVSHCVFGGPPLGTPPNQKVFNNDANRGGAIFISGNDGPITIGDRAAVSSDRNRIAYNIASGEGGGICIDRGRDGVMIGGTDIMHNDAKGWMSLDGGGGISVMQFDRQNLPDAQKVQKYHLQVQQCAIEGNTAVTRGGGILVSWASQVELSETTIQANQAESGAGVFVDMGGVVKVDGGKIADNTAVAEGGGFRIINSWVELKNAGIEGNHGRSGGGAHVQANQPDARYAQFFAAVNHQPIGRITVSDNAALSNNGATVDGGGLRCVGNRHAQNADLDVDIQGASVSQNTAGNGAGADLEGVRTVTITNSAGGSSSFYHNTASGDGGGFRIDDCATVSVTGNTSFEKNGANRGAGILIKKCAVSAATVTGNVFDNNKLTGARAIGQDVLFEACTYNPDKTRVVNDIENANHDPSGNPAKVAAP